MAESRLGSETEARFPGSLAAGEFELEPVTLADLRRMAGLVRTFADFPLGAADASVVAITERLKGNPRRNAGPPPLPGGATGALPGL